MKISNLFILRNIAGEYLLIPTGSATSRVQGLLSLNETGALLYRNLSEDCTAASLAAALTAEYDVSPEEAAADAAEFLQQMRELGIVLED